MRKSGKWAALQPRLLVIGVGLALGLAGCGGGGGNLAVKPTPPPTDNPPPDNPPPSNEQPDIDTHLALTNTNAAHDAGFYGEGITIGVVDTGINRDHPALKGRVVDSLVYLDPNENDLTTDDVVGHGTWVSQIAAGTKFGQWPGGIAPEADLVSARIISDKEPEDDGSGNGNQVEASDAAFFAQTLHPDLIDAGVQIMNNSWGGLYFDPDNVDDVAAAFAAAYRPFVIDHGGLVVFATGNEGKANPTDTASLPNWSSDLEKGWLVAAALDSLDPTKLDDYSNACGRAMDYCLVAPGDVIVTGADDTAGNPDYWVVSGTSFATPQVSGAAALVWDAFPYFDNDLVRQTLLGTAKDIGDPGVDKTFGWGLLDVGKAVKGPAQFAWGDVSVDFDTITSTWSNDISGAGGLVKDGTGILQLTGDNSYAGGTSIVGGTVQAAFALPGDASVGTAGTLDGVPGVAGNLDNAGIVAVRGGDTDVGGDYHQSADGALWVSLGSVLNVDGSATLDGGDLHVIGQEDGYVTTSHQDLLTAGDGVTGTFDSLSFADGVFLSSTLQYAADAVWLDTTSLSITAAAQAQGMNPTPASMGSAQRVESAFQQIDANLAAGGNGGVSGDFLQAAGAFQRAPNQTAAQRSLESLSGQLHASSAAMTLAAIDASNQAMTQRFDNLLDAHKASGMWTNNLSVGGNMARSGFDGVGYQLNGWLVGSDTLVGAHGVTGFAFGQSQGTQQLDDRFDRNRSRNTEAMLYAGWIGTNWYTQGRVGFGRYHQNVSRQLLLGSSWQGVWTDYNGRYDVAYAESGYRMGYGNSHLTPFVDVQYARIQRDGFAEQGAGGFGLKSAAQDIGRWQAGVGLRAAHRWDFSGERSLDLSARVEWQRTLATYGDVFDASFVGLDQWQPLGGIGLSRQSALFGIGLDAALSRNASLNFGYDYRRGDRIEDNMMSARFNVAF